MWSRGIEILHPFGDGAAVAAVLDPPVEARQELARHQAELIRCVRFLVESFGHDASRDKIKLAEPEAVEPRCSG